MSPQEIILAHLQQKDLEEQEYREYAESGDPQRLLRRRIRDLIACTAASVIDYQMPTKEPPPHGLEVWPYDEHLSRTAKRLAEDPLFNRLVSMQTAGIVQEIERYEEGKRRRLR